jgi:hypothetical protein
MEAVPTTGDRDGDTIPLHARVVCRRPVDRRDLAAHGTDVRAELPTVVNEVEQRGPHHAAEGRLLPLIAAKTPAASLMDFGSSMGPSRISPFSISMARTGAWPATNAVSSIADRDFG